MKVIAMKCTTPLNKEDIDKRGVQLIDLSYVAGKGHIEFAIDQAKRAFERRTNISDDIFVEVLVRMSGQRQIKKAIQLFGLKDSKEVAVIFEGKHEDFFIPSGCSRDDSIFRIDQKKYERIKRAYNISEREIEIVNPKDRFKALEEIIKERVAMVSVL
jgi:KEOPS complex subunit Cgi121